jgi:hypothetical protein
MQKSFVYYNISSFPFLKLGAQERRKRRYSDLHEKAISRNSCELACLGTITSAYTAVNSLQFNPSRDFCYMQVGRTHAARVTESL